ncbi:EF-hand domain-containing protein [Pararhizobium sp. BT-229]|uniref:EF-hand domain-containing protein n=1 Tax=Pararhizobium sp. BT-229 TaxID=2986923 RepID=UPI0021F70F67|nr:EF-hand domain-containing protein [Pararhizobium sp. BT-229]MCV9966059.1 EF-hand domain-containing protein [Pararhizobium sp. BT-229]
MKKLAMIATILLCQTAPVLAQEQAAAMHQGHKDKLDSNSNGTVERSEYQAFMTTAFTSLDKNKDGSLQSAEVEKVLTTQQFALSDANRDGVVGRSEFMDRVMNDFTAADRSGDGNLQ